MTKKLTEKLSRPSITLIKDIQCELFDIMYEMLKSMQYGDFRPEPLYKDLYTLKDKIDLAVKEEGIEDG